MNSSQLLIELLRKQTALHDEYYFSLDHSSYSLVIPATKVREIYWNVLNFFEPELKERYFYWFASWQDGTIPAEELFEKVTTDLAISFDSNEVE